MSLWQNSYHQLADHFIFYYFIKAATKNFNLGRLWRPLWTKQNNSFFFSAPPLLFCLCNDLSDQDKSLISVELRLYHEKNSKNFL